MNKSIGKVWIILIMFFISFTFYIYKAEPDFLLERFYERIYADRFAAAPVVLLNEIPTSFDLTSEKWSIQKNNGQWYTAPSEYEASVSANGPEPAAITSLDDKLTVTFDKEPDRANLKIIESDSGQIILDERVELPDLPLPKKNGAFTYELALEWTGESSPYRGGSVLEIPVTVNLPEEFVFSEQCITQGQMIEVTVYYADRPEDLFLEQSIDKKFRWFQQDGLIRGYLPTNYNVEPGVYQIKYGVRSKGMEDTKRIEVFAYDYHIQYLTVDSKTEKETRNDAAYAEYYKYYTPVRNQSEPSRYYTESFLLPVRGRLTTEFGETRYVNDFPTSYRHLGLDIAAAAGTEVKAVNRGKVVLARSLILTGNTVMIDHGEGLFSVYHHLLNLSVKTDEIVERGQKIGEVGSTGFSTGPHLHFMISYYTTNLEPGYFLVGQPITYENYKELIQ